MKKLISIYALLTAALVFSSVSQAQEERFEAGIAAGTSHAFAGDTFKSATTSGPATSYWLGYGLDKNWGLELGLDQFNFEKTNYKHQAIAFSGVYRFLADNWIHPVAKLGLGSYETKNTLDEKTASFGAKAAAGIEADFKYASVGALVNYHFVTKAGDTDALKNVQAFVPAIFLTLHNEVERASKSVSTAPAAKVEAAPVVVAKKDSDGDGISDDEDKCPNTPANVAVNKYGCAEKEKASVKINIEFSAGKAVVEEKHQSEVESLAQFMKKFSETHVEISGYTDNVGSAKLNTSLSQKRAEAVKQALVKAGIDAKRLTAKGFGPANPVADNKTAEGRAQNRRVMAEISVVTDKKK